MAIDKLGLYNAALRHLGDIRLATLTDDVEARYALDDAFDRAVGYVLQQAAWHFALKTAPLTPVATVIPGYAHQATLPTDCLQQQAYFISTSDGRECPFDLREQGSVVAWNTGSAVHVRYVSSDFVTPTSAWTEHFFQVAAVYLAFIVANRDTGERSAAERMAKIFASLFPEAVKSDAIPWDVWLPYQRNGEFLRAARVVIGGGNWTFSGAMKTLQIDVTGQVSTEADPGFPYRFALPSDWLRTQSLYVPWDGQECPFNIREDAQQWSTDTPAWVVRYVSSDALDSTRWPEAVTKSVQSYLAWQNDDSKEQIEGAEFQSLLTAALKQYAITEDPWLRFQLDGRYRQAVAMLLEKGRWRFAVKTLALTDENNTTGATSAVAGDPNSVSDGSVSPGYSCRMLKPNDWLRTLRVYYSYSDGLRPLWLDVDFRDELDAIHVNYNPVQMRYVSRLGLDATRWPSNFRDATLAWLEHVEARADPKQIAVAVAKLKLYEAQCKEAELLDDTRDVPRVNSVGRFVGARYGRRSNTDQAQDWWPY